MVKAFVDVQKWYNIIHFHSVAQKNTLVRKVSGILLHLNGEFSIRFQENLDDICLGYNLFLKEYVTRVTPTTPDTPSSSSTRQEVSMEAFYQDFWKQYQDTPEMEAFIEFFEFLQIKSYSEAICESVGSIMNMATGTFLILEFLVNSVHLILLQIICSFRFCNA